MITLQNEKLRLRLDLKGAELQEIFSKETGLNYLWNGNPQYWARHSPVLFPIVGGLKEDTFWYGGNPYKLVKHGFARDLAFKPEGNSDTSASLVLKSSPETLQHYPFQFSLKITYELRGNTVVVTYKVENTDDKTIYFSVGAHPAFNVPLVEGTRYEDYYLKFEQQETADRWTLDQNLVSGSVPYLENDDRLPLKPELFYNDALIFKNLKSTRVSLLSDKTRHGLSYGFEGFPYLGIWAAKDAPFVCIEPWYGLADNAGHNQHIEEKEGIIALDLNQSWTGSWNVEVF